MSCPREKKNNQLSFVSKVVAGGNFDCDLEVKAPSGKSLYKDTKKQYDSFTWITDEKGEYSFCFSNEFSTFTHKVIYFDWQVGAEPPLRPGMDQVHTMTLVSATALTK